MIQIPQKGDSQESSTGNREFLVDFNLQIINKQAGAELSRAQFSYKLVTGLV